MRVRAIASSVPARRVTNEEIIEEVIRGSAPHLTAEQLERATGQMRSLFRLAGCKVRRLRSEGERAGDFALRAAHAALDKAELTPQEIDLLMYVGVGRGWVEPGMSHYFADALGLRNATCFDLIDACLSWLRALHIGWQFLKNGVYRNILVLNAEFNVAEHMPRVLRHPEELEYRFAQYTVGEAATATILSAGDGEPPYFEFKTDASLHTLCKIPLPQIGQYSSAERCPSLDPLVFFAYSGEMFKAAKEVIAERVLNSPELSRLAQIVDIIFAHSASKSLINWLDDSLGGDGRTINIFEEYGNTASASIPLAMCCALQDGRLQRGMKTGHIVGSSGFSAGFGYFVY